MSDKSEFDAQKAKMWKAEVDSEFALVKEVLAKVTEECTKDPVGEDTILKAVESAGNFLNERWTDLRKAYDQIQEKLGGSFKSYESTINEGVRLVEEMKSKIKI